MNKIIVALLLLLTFSSQFLMAELTTTQTEYSKGYFFSKLEDRFPNETIDFDLQDQKIIIFVFPSDSQTCKQIQEFLESYSGFTVLFDAAYRPAPHPFLTDTTIEESVEEGDFLPEVSTFFPTMLAQPHIVGYSAGYRSYDRRFKISCLPVSIGDQFSLYQFKTVSHGRFYFGIEACVWAIFEARAKSLSLINADYFIALPFTYINDKFSTRFRLYHESSHLGDEFLLENRRIKRLNPSMEVADLFAAYEFSPRLTTFAGISRVLRSDESYKIKPWGFHYGFNYYADFWKVSICNLEAIPYFSAYFTNLEENRWQLDSSIALGYQWDKSYGHKLRVYIEAHDGYSYEGQFSKQKTKYVALKFLYGY